MKTIFFIKSSTVNLENYNIKDIPGSSGRLDVISRVILSALFSNHELDRNIQIWVFLDNYGTFIIDSENISVNNFPKNEILLTDFLVKYILNTTEKKTPEYNPLKLISYLKIDIFEEINNFIRKGYEIFVLNENGKNFQNYFLNLNHVDNVLFIIGDQSGVLLDTEQLRNLNLTKISFGKQSYLASSVIRLIKLNLRLLVG